MKKLTFYSNKLRPNASVSYYMNLAACFPVSGMKFNLKMIQDLKPQGDC